ncbi:MAG: LacI family DNA-binding transcriptional regulator [Oscillospiraceae bacterium]
MSLKKSTIYDIAKACNMSTATVSRALNNTGYPVNEKTKALILKTAKELHYTPNMFGKNLKTRQSKDIGVIVPNISNPYYSTLLQGVYDDAISRGYNPILLNSFRNHEIETKNIDTLMQKQVCGIIIVSISQNSSAIQRALDYGCPVVVVEQDIDVNCIKVGFNFLKGAYLATQHLIENNHRKIGFIGAPLDRPSRVKMLNGYKQCLMEHQIPINEDYIMLENEENDVGQIYEFKNGIAAAKAFSNMKEYPTGYICINDMTALGAIKQFNKSALNVPEHISVIGFDNIPYAEISTPELTTIDQCAYDMGSFSARTLIESIEDPGKPHFSVTMEPSLVIRNTVKKI